MVKSWVFAIMIVDTILGAFGSIFLKKGSHRIHKNNMISQFKNYDLIFGVFLFVISTPIFLIALKATELSRLYPMTSLTYVWISLLSIKYLKEQINAYKWLGIILIIVGIIFITLK